MKRLTDFLAGIRIEPMNSIIADKLKLHYPPVIVEWTDTAPEKAIRFEHGRWGCIMFLLAAAAKGKVAVCDRDSFGCVGGGTGMGFGNQYPNFPGGEPCFCRFLSGGNAGDPTGEAVAEQMKPSARPETLEDFLEGERYLKTPERVRTFIDNLPIREIPSRFVVFRSMDDPEVSGQEPRTVIFLADPDQLSALVVLANYDRDSADSVIIPFAAGCQAIGIYPYREAESDPPRAVVGLVDLSARMYVRKSLGRDLFTFAVPWSMYREMETNAPGSFLDRATWRHLMAER